MARWHSLDPHQHASTGPVARIEDRRYVRSRSAGLRSSAGGASSVNEPRAASVVSGRVLDSAHERCSDRRAPRTSSGPRGAVRWRPGCRSSADLPVEWSDTRPSPGSRRSAGSASRRRSSGTNLVVVTSQAGTGVVAPGSAARAERQSARGRRARARRRPAAGDGHVTFVVTAFDRATRTAGVGVRAARGGPLPPVHEKHNLASPSPATDGERVYAWFGTGQIAAIDMTGALVWKKHLGAEYGPFEINWGHGSSPVVHRDTLRAALLSRQGVVPARARRPDRRRALEGRCRRPASRPTARRSSSTPAGGRKSSSTRASA